MSDGPACGVEIGGVAYYKAVDSPRCISSDPAGLHFFRNYNPFEWGAMTYRWRSPCKRSMEHGLANMPPDSLPRVARLDMPG